MNNTFDAIIIGTGQAGPPLAKRLSDAGMSVAIVERHLFGGTCVNTGCIPTKAMVASAYAAQHGAARRRIRGRDRGRHHRRHARGQGEKGRASPSDRASASRRCCEA